MTASYRFGPVSVDPGTRTVRVEGRAAPVGGRAFDVLLALIEHRDRLVTKDELLAMAWPGLVVEENNLQVQISALRRVLGQGAIATVPGRGYRLALEATAERAAEPSGPRSNLPVSAVSFVGREKEIAEIAALLQRHRLVTLVGAGGIGKTRLALEIASGAAGDFPEGVRFVDLASISDARLVADAFVAGAGIAQQPGTPAPDLIAQHAATARQLVVLDNCEHLLVPCAHVVKTVLGSGRGMRILATSREPLRTSGESTYPVPPLAVPDPAHADKPVAIAAFDAVRLFVDRAEAARPGFDLTQQNAPSIAAICRALDGIPLALELAAARARALTPEAIALRLDDRFRLLKDGDRTALPRQQTLRATIDWSYDLLSAGEQALLRRLSVFAGGFALDAAEAVGAGNGLHAADVVELLTHLVDKSLVTPDAGGERYRLFETVRQYALDRLRDAGEAEAAFAAHGAFYVDLARRAGPELLAEAQHAWHVRLDAERENILQVVARALAPGGDVEGIFTFLYRLRTWLARAYLQQWHRFATEALASPADSASALGRAHGLYAAAFLSYLMGRYEESRVWCTESIRLARLCEDDLATGEAHCQLGACLLALSPAEAEAQFQQGLALGQKLDNLDLIIYGHAGLGELYSLQGRWDRADESYRQSLVLARRLKSGYHAAIAQGNVARSSIELGNRSAAILHLRECAAFYEGQPSVQIGQILLSLCAGLATAERDLPVAARLWGASDAQRARHGLHAEPCEAPFGERTLASIRAHGDRAAMEAAIEEGRALDDAEAFARAREWLEGLRP